MASESGLLVDREEIINRQVMQHRLDQNSAGSEGKRRFAVQLTA